MGKQDKRDKKAKKAEAKAEKIIAEAKAAVAAKRETEYDHERVEGVSDDDFMAGVEVRRLREAGEPWWSIAKALELPGWGQSATTGKKGAAKARSVYKAAFGDFPRTFKKGGYKGPVETNEQVKALKKQKRSELREQVRGGKAVISEDLSDEEVAAALKGRRIRWFMKNDFVPDGIELDAAIHTKTPFYVYEENGHRVIEFRERATTGPVNIRGLPGKTRTVRVSAIFSVK